MGDDVDERTCLDSVKVDVFICEMNTARKLAHPAPCNPFQQGEQRTLLQIQSDSGPSTLNVTAKDPICTNYDDGLYDRCNCPVSFDHY